MKKIFIILALVAIVSVVWLASTNNFFKKEPVPVIKIGILYKGANFKQVADGFMQGFSKNLPKDRKVEYIIKDEPGSEQNDYDLTAQVLVDNKVDLIVAIGIEPVRAAEKVTATNKIPVILELGINPVTQGIIESFQRPGGNITGVTFQAEELTGKRLEFLKMIDPSVKHITIFRKKKTDIMDVPLQYLTPVAKIMGVTVTIRDFSDLAELQKEVLATTASNTDAIFYAPDPFVQRNSELIIKHAIEQKLPVMFHEDFITKNGATASYGANFSAAGKQGARLALKVLIDKQPIAEIPAEAVSRIDFIINLVNARAIGLSIPDDIISLAQGVIK